MFVLRSAFWLVLAFVVMKPGIDLNSAAETLTGQAMAAGQQVIAEQILQSDCDSLTCVGGKAILAAAINSTPTVVTPMQDTPIVSLAPIPHMRPDFLG